MSGWAVGLMTGTVLDGEIDAVLLRTDGARVAEYGPFRAFRYEAGVQALLEEALEAARRWNFEGPEPTAFAEAEARLTEAQAAAVAALCAPLGLGRVEIVGFHGQTVLHRPPAPGRPGRTRQLGDGALMARLLGRAVAYDFRSADMAAGGQGAPLAPLYHLALLRDAPGAAALNLGGVANITAPQSGGDVIAFDTGPANAPINDWVRAHGLGAMDRDGALARAGRVDEGQLAALLADPWFAAAPPKSLDRNSFTAAMADGLCAEDGAALLTEFAAGAVAKALAHLPAPPARLIACGGGRRNPALMDAIARRTGVPTVSAEAHGWRGDAVEAECFAFLAQRVRRGLPISLPGATGVARPMTGGRIAYP